MDFRLGMALIVTLLLWASAFAAIRETVQHYTPGAMALLRFSVASLALVIYGFLRKVRLPDSKDLPAIVFCGLFGVPIYHVLLNYGEQSVDSGTAAFLINTSPVFTALIARFYLKEHLRPLGWLGIFVSFCGIPLIALAKEGHFEFNAHALLIVAAALSASIYVAAQKKQLKKYSALEFTMYIMVSGCLCMLFFAPQVWRGLNEAPTRSTLLVVYLGVFPGAIAYVTWTYILSKMPASRAISFLYLVPPLAVLFGWIFLGEAPKPLAIVGGALALTGVVIVNRWGRVTT
jgi:drug/metabolite transporter (DMT)-like permease